MLVAAGDDALGLGAGLVRAYSGADGTLLFAWYGTQSGEAFGRTVRAAGDVNGDGHADAIVGADQTPTGFPRGCAHVFSGLDGSRLHLFEGGADGDAFRQVSGAGDVDADGFDDLIVGGMGDDTAGSGAGVVRVLSGLDGHVLHVLYGAAPGEGLGISVSGAGDWNGDGHADFLVGAAFADGPNGAGSGRAAVHSGNDGSVLFQFFGNSAGDRFGASVDAAGDVNGDGIPDGIVGAPADGLFGPSSGSARVLSGADGNVLWEWYGSAPSQQFGIRVAGLGDLDGDGFADLGVVPSVQYGRALAYSGRDGSVLYAFGRPDTREPFQSLAGAGDVNGDGYGDLVVGSLSAGVDRVLVLSGREHVVPFCFGDESVVDCPCINPGARGEGCANSSGAGGLLSATGSASLVDDELTFTALQLLPAQPALLFAGTNAVNGGFGQPFGDGLRCAGGALRRLGIRAPEATGSATWGPGLSRPGGWEPGDLRRFQAWYRDPGGPCDSGFNLTGAIEVVFSL